MRTLALRFSSNIPHSKEHFLLTWMAPICRAHSQPGRFRMSLKNGKIIQTNFSETTTFLQKFNLNAQQLLTNQIHIQLVPATLPIFLSNPHAIATDLSNCFSSPCENKYGRDRFDLGTWLVNSCFALKLNYCRKVAVSEELVWIIFPFFRHFLNLPGWLWARQISAIQVSEKFTFERGMFEENRSASVRIVPL